MIAQINTAESFRDVLDYLMNPKKLSVVGVDLQNNSNSNFVFDNSEFNQNAVAYKDNERHRIIGGNLGGQTVDELNREFKSVSSLRPEIKKQVWHISISANKKDLISVDLWREISTEIIEKLGFGESAFVIIQHRDREHNHIHIVTSKIDVRGQIVNDWQSKRRTETILRELEIRYNLEKTVSSKDTIRSAPRRNEIELLNKTGEKSIKLKMQEKVEKAFQASNEVFDFINNLTKERVLIVPIFASEKIHKNDLNQKELVDDKVIGVCFWHENELMKGSNLGKGFSWTGLQSRGLNYQPNRHNELFTNVKKESEVKIETAKRNLTNSKINQISSSIFVVNQKVIDVELRPKFLSELEVKEAEYQLLEHIKTKETQKFEVTINENKQDVTKFLSLIDLTRQRHSYALFYVKNDTDTGFIKMLIEDEKITRDEACQKTFWKAVNTIYDEQIEIIKQIEAAYKTKHLELLQNLEISKLNYQKVSELILSDNSLNNNTILPETIWKEQIKAIKRNDFESFKMLESIHQENNIPRPNKVYSDLRSLEFLKLLEARQANFNLFDGTVSKTIVVKISKNDEGKLNVTDFRISKEVKLSESKSFNQNDLIRFVNSNKDSNKDLNLHQILKNEPNLKIIETVHNYVQANSKLELLENLAQESFKHHSSKNEAAFQSAENLKFLAEAVNKANFDEEFLRLKLSENNYLDKTNLEQPQLAFTKTELNQIINITIELGDTKLLENRLIMLSRNTKMAQAIDQTPERMLAKILISQAENVESASKVIENFKQNNENEIEVELNIVQLIKTGYQIETSNLLENQLSKNCEEFTPIFKHEEIGQANEIIKKNIYLQESRFEKYIRSENYEFGKEVLKQLNKPYTAAEINFLELDNEIIEKFAQIERRNAFMDAQLKEIENCKVEIPTQSPTIKTYYESDLREEKERDFWRNDRLNREAKIATERREVFENSTKDEQKAILAKEDAESDLVKQEMAEDFVMKM